jgi:hypothetical protein
MPTNPRETPIERIFREVMGRKMPLSIKGVLLSKFSARLQRTKTSKAQGARNSQIAKKKTLGTSYPNVLDYPGSMSQWEKESLAAEARLSSEEGTTKQVKAKSKRKRKPRESIGN